MAPLRSANSGSRRAATPMARCRAPARLRWPEVPRRRAAAMGAARAPPCRRLLPRREGASWQRLRSSAAIAIAPLARLRGSAPALVAVAGLRGRWPLLPRRCGYGRRAVPLRLPLGGARLGSLGAAGSGRGPPCGGGSALPPPGDAPCGGRGLDSAACGRRPSIPPPLSPSGGKGGKLREGR